MQILATYLVVLGSASQYRGKLRQRGKPDTVGIQRLPKRLIFIDCADDGLNGAVRRGRTRLQIGGKGFHLEPLDVRCRHEVQTIEVVLLEMIEFDQHHIFGTWFDKRIGEEPADAPQPDYSVP